MRRLGLKFDVVTPFAGKIDKVLFRLGERVEEGDTLFSVNVNGVTYDILSPVTGFTDTVEVDQGDFVISGMILAAIIQTDAR